MKIQDITGKSKVAARIRNLKGRIKKHITITICEHGPESVQLTGSLPRTKGWRVALDVPIKKNGRKDYIKFLQLTDAHEVWIKVATAGGKSKVYIR